MVYEFYFFKNPSIGLNKINKFDSEYALPFIKKINPELKYLLEKPNWIINGHGSHSIISKYTHQPELQFTFVPDKINVIFLEKFGSDLFTIASNESLPSFYGNQFLDQIKKNSIRIYNKNTIIPNLSINFDEYNYNLSYISGLYNLSEIKNIYSNLDATEFNTLKNQYNGNCDIEQFITFIKEYYGDQQDEILKKFPIECKQFFNKANNGRSDITLIKLFNWLKENVQDEITLFISACRPCSMESFSREILYCKRTYGSDIFSGTFLENITTDRRILSRQGSFSTLNKDINKIRLIEETDSYLSNFNQIELKNLFIQIYFLDVLKENPRATYGEYFKYIDDYYREKLGDEIYEIFNDDLIQNQAKVKKYDFKNIQSILDKKTKELNNLDDTKLDFIKKIFYINYIVKKNIFVLDDFCKILEFNKLKKPFFLNLKYELPKINNIGDVLAQLKIIPESYDKLINVNDLMFIAIRGLKKGFFNKFLKIKLKYIDKNWVYTEFFPENNVEQDNRNVIDYLFDSNLFNYEIVDFNFFNLILNYRGSKFNIDDSYNYITESDIFNLDYFFKKIPDKNFINKINIPDTYGIPPFIYYLQKFEFRSGNNRLKTFRRVNYQQEPNIIEFVKLLKNNGLDPTISFQPYNYEEILNTYWYLYYLKLDIINTSPINLSILDDIIKIFNYYEY